MNSQEKRINHALVEATYPSHSGAGGRMRHFKPHHIVAILEALRPVLGPDMYEDVADFHRKFRPSHMQPRPCIPTTEMAALIHELVAEEAVEELLPALERVIMLSEREVVQPHEMMEALAAVADGAADLIYVIMGAVQACGIDLRPVWRVVQAANMAKEGGDVREDGKIMKPADWRPPDVAGVLRQLGTRQRQHPAGLPQYPGENMDTLYE